MIELKFRAWTDAEIMRYDIMPVDDRVAIDLKSPSFEQIWEEFDYMQWSGFSDRNKKDIYEGDVLSEKWRAEVYQNDEGTFMVRFNNNSAINRPMSLKKYLQHMKKAGTDDINNIVIGNIYQNPELCEN